MPGKIFIEAKPIPYLFGMYYHSYLVYENETGEEFIIRGGPQYNGNVGGRQWGEYGKIVMEAGTPIKQSEDYRGKSEIESRGRKEIDLGGRDASSIWEQMKETAQKVDYKYDYQLASAEDSLAGSMFADSFISRNSNSATSFILKSAGIDTASHLPLNATQEDLPGFDDPLPDFDNDDFYTLPLGWMSGKP
jgi:hypothetical protein